MNAFERNFFDDFCERKRAVTEDYINDAVIPFNPRAEVCEEPPSKMVLLFLGVFRTSAQLGKKYHLSPTTATKTAGRLMKSPTLAKLRKGAQGALPAYRKTAQTLNSRFGPCGWAVSSWTEFFAADYAPCTKQK